MNKIGKITRSLNKLKITRFTNKIAKITRFMNKTIKITRFENKIEKTTIFVMIF